VWPDGPKPQAIIIDLDGTLCNVDHRLHHVRTPEGVKKNWKAFFDGLKDDTINGWCYDIINKFSGFCKIVYCSGRPDDHKKSTLEWLKNHGCWDGTWDPNLYMRSRGDHRQDNIVKEMLLEFEILTRFEPYLIIDDRPSVCRMWRSRGYTVLQCNDKEF
jgi:predicted secreted acid phosphatase